jgi:arylformamidase
VLTLRDRDGAEGLSAVLNVGLMNFGNGAVSVDLTNPISLAIDLDFSHAQPRHFGAPLATSRPFAVPGFSGSVAHGASCNCQTLTLVPHCNGTHTECVGHLTREPLDAHRVTPLGFVPAVLVSIEPVDAETSKDSTDPIPQPGDKLITRQALERSWSAAAVAVVPEPHAGTDSESRTDSRSQPARKLATAASEPRLPTPFEPRALVIRTLPNSATKQHQDYSDSTPPYLTREAAELLVERGIEHLVVDLPSIDRSHDEGHLTAHRIFFGLPSGSTALAQATRARATVTELAYIPDAVSDGAYLLELQVPALGGDAVPSRPLLYRLSGPSGPSGPASQAPRASKPS